MFRNFCLNRTEKITLIKKSRLELNTKIIIIIHYIRATSVSTNSMNNATYFATLESIIILIREENRNCHYVLP